jgi:alcohol dehydrogenase (cytochrome c)
LDIRLARCTSEHLGVSTIEVSRVTTRTLKTGVTTLMAAAIGTTLAGNALGQDKPADWPSYNRTLSGDRYAPQAAVTPATAKQLQQICSYDLGRQSSFQTGPVVIDDTIFVTTDFDTIAIDGATCAPKWRTTETYTAAGPLKVNRGAAVADGRVFRGTQDGRVLAYDASSGKRIWEVRIANPALGETVPAALIAWQGLVFAGNAGGDNKGVKGRMYALNATTGEVVWEQYLVPRQGGDQSYGPHAPAPTLPSAGWGNAADVPITGGATWTSYSLDPASATLYVPAGNPGPDFARELRPGVNPYAGTLIALDAKTGAVRMTYPLVQRDYHDWDVSAAPAVFTTRGGVKIAAEAIKTGHVYGIDTATGRHLWNVPTTTVENVQAPLSASSNTRFCPGTQGGTEWNGASYSPQTNLVYVGAVDWCTTVKLASDDAIKAGKSGQPWGGADGKEPFGELDPPGRWAGWITAIDADRGKVVWKRKLPAPVLGGVTPTAGGVVFAADMLGNVYAFNALTGATVWHTQTSGAVGGGIVSYATPSGAQRIAVAAGMTSPIWPTAKVNAEMVVYGLK